MPAAASALERAFQMARIVFGFVSICDCIDAKPVQVRKAGL